MTKLRKLTALLLAGALTLLLLTACSGGGGSSGPEAQAEAKVMQAINNGRAVALANDDGMRTVANARLDALELVLKGNALGYQFFNKVDAKWDNDNKNATLTLVAKYDYNDTTLQKIIDQIKGSDQKRSLGFCPERQLYQGRRSGPDHSRPDLCCHLPAGGQESLISSRFSPHLV